MTVKADDCVAVAGVGIGLIVLGYFDSRPVPMWHAGLVVVGCSVVVGVLRKLQLMLKWKESNNA